MVVNCQNDTLVVVLRTNFCRVALQHLQEHACVRTRLGKK
jgi:hypothetical protein